MPEDTPRPAPTSVKVVITGPWAVGKTTLIRNLSEISVLTTERTLAGLDDDDALAMDFGRLTIDESLSLHLFGTESDTAHLEEMWKVVAEGLLGLIVVIDDSRPDSYSEAMPLLAYFAERTEVPYVVAVNKVPPGQEQRAVQRAHHSLRIPQEVRVIATDVRDRDQAKHVLLELLFAIGEDELQAARSAAAT